MRVPLLLLLVLLPLTSCRDAEETALNQLQDVGYGFAVSDYHRAAASGDVKAVQRFLAAGMAVDVEGENGQTAFQVAAEAEQDAMTRFLIEAGAGVDQRLAEGRTLLMQVAGRTDTDLRLLEFLLANQADAKAMDSAGMTPLMIAGLAGNVDGVRALAMRDVRSLDKTLMLAAAQGHTHCLEELVERGAYVNCRSHDGETPLMFAASKGHREVAQVLLRHHANRFALDEEGKSAADRAESVSHEALAVLLRDTSDLIPPKVPGNNEFLPSLDGQLIAFLSEPAVGEMPFLDPLEPERPVLDPVTELDETAPTAATEGDANEAPQASTKPVAPPQPTASVQPVATPVDMKKAFRLGRFQERFEPLLVTEVTAEKAKVRLLHRPPEHEAATIMVMVGQPIPDTPYEVSRMTKRVRPAKGGGTVDVSEVIVNNTKTKAVKRLVRGSMPRGEDTHLEVEAKGSQKRFAARMGDVFTVAETQEQFAVQAIRPHQLLLRRVATGEYFTIERG